MKKRIISFLTAVLLLLSVFIISAGALTPKWTPTAAYRESKYYQQLIAVGLTGDGRRDILNVAFSQLGYHEGNSQSDFDGMNTAGSNNYVEFNYANRAVYSNNNTYSYAWCASFVTWCARQAGISTSIIKNSVSCDSFVSDFMSKSRYKTRASGYIPIAGDLIFFMTPGADRTYASHIGIVVGTDSEYVYTIEGNTGSGLVKCKSYKFSDTYIVGYAVPSYGGVTGNYSDFPLISDTPMPGVYSVTATSLNMRSGTSTSYAVLAALPKGTEITVTEISDNWGKATYGNVTGWVSFSYLEAVDTSEYTVTYDANGGEAAPVAATGRAGARTELSDSEPSRVGFEFLGWAKAADADTAEYQPGDAYTVNADLTLYAVWSPIPITVEFLDSDGSVISRTVYTYGEELTVPPEPKAKFIGELYFVFVSWDKPIITPVRSDRSYTAVYELTEAPGEPTSAALRETEASDGTGNEPGNPSASDCSSLSAYVNAATLTVLMLSAGIAVLIKKKL